MRHGVAAFIAGALAAGPALAQEERPLTDCAGVVGAWLTNNPGKEPSRSLITLTSDGLVLFADSGQGGGAGFAPFSGGHGAWRCVSAATGSLEISAAIYDFTLPTVDWPNQQIGRLDIAATVDPEKATMSGKETLYVAPLDGDPLGNAKLVEDAEGAFTAVRITAP